MEMKHWNATCLVLHSLDTRLDSILLYKWKINRALEVAKILGIRP